MWLPTVDYEIGYQNCIVIRDVLMENDDLTSITPLLRILSGSKHCCWVRLSRGLRSAFRNTLAFQRLQQVCVVSRQGLLETQKSAAWKRIETNLSPAIMVRGFRIQLCHICCTSHSKSKLIWSYNPIKIVRLRNCARNRSLLLPTPCKYSSFWRLPFRLTLCYHRLLSKK